MSTRSTRSRAARTEDAQTLVKDYFKTTRKPTTRTRGEKKLIDVETASETTKTTVTRTTRVKKEKEASVEVKTKPKVVENPAPIFEKPTRTRSPIAADVTATPPKKTRVSIVLEDDTPVIKTTEPPVKSALDELIQVPVVEKKKKIRTVADLQAKLAQNGAAKAIHEQNLKNKSKKVEEHAELLKSPSKSVSNVLKNESPAKKPKTARKLVTSSKIPEYVLPGSVEKLQKSAEKVREQADKEHDLEVERRTNEYMKTSKLTEEVKESIKMNMELPKTYESLATAFQHVDRIVSIISSQNRSIVAPELYKNVKNTSQKEFSSLHLSQILHVYPQSYNVVMREQWKAFGGTQSGKYELEIKPNLVDDLRGFVKEDSPVNATDNVPLVMPKKLMASPMKSPRKGGPAQPIPRPAELDTRKRLDAARMRDRAYVFRHKMVEIVKEHYTKFLEEQGIQFTKKLVRMHPLFNPDKHCPILEQQPLPEPPIMKSKNHIGMREYMEQNLEPKEVELPSCVQKALDDLKSPQKVTSGNVPLSPKKFADMQKEQKSKGAMSLLERIRAKEAVRKAAEACVDESLKIRTSRLALLDTRYLRTLCSIYATKKARSMEMDGIAEKLVFSTTVPTSRAEIIPHLELLCSIASSYISEATVMGKRYLQLNDNNYAAIAELVRDELQKAQNATKEQIKQMDDAHKIAVNAQPSHAPRPFSPKISKATRALKFA